MERIQQEGEPLTTLFAHQHFTHPRPPRYNKSIVTSINPNHACKQHLQFLQKLNMNLDLDQTTMHHNFALQKQNTSCMHCKCSYKKKGTARMKKCARLHSLPEKLSNYARISKSIKAIVSEMRRLLLHFNQVLRM
jgi:hypothetical protein